MMIDNDYHNHNDDRSGWRKLQKVENHVSKSFQLRSGLRDNG